MARRPADTTRITATIPRHHGEALERLAAREHVPVAYIVRRAIERAITDAEGGLLAGLGSPATSGKAVRTYPGPGKRTDAS